MVFPIQLPIAVECVKRECSATGPILLGPTGPSANQLIATSFSTGIRFACAYPSLVTMKEEERKRRHQSDVNWCCIKTDRLHYRHYQLPNALDLLTTRNDHLHEIVSTLLFYRPS
uniref:Uncharacterized protein n=1 Tax=Cacopsylla melanoneura TaxID=428564 RepID=A0A8D8ZLX9_9HEMI